MNKMSLNQYYLAKLAEECAEVAQRALKSMQFGANEIQTGQEKTNCERLSEELNDLLAVMHHLQTLGEVTIENDEEVNEYYRVKIEKIKKYLKYSQKLGMVGKS